MKRVLAIDPGSTTGFVVVDFEVSPGLDINRARIVGSGVVRSSRKIDAESVAEHDLLFIGKIAAVIKEYSPSLVALEEPSDAADYWGAGQDLTKATVEQIATGGAVTAKKGFNMKRGTLFRLGVHYALALAAVREAGHADVVSYQVRGSKNRAGWMGHGTKRSNVLREMTYLFAKLSYRPVAQLKVTEHELMALGVLNFHAAQFTAIAPRGTVKR